MDLHLVTLPPDLRAQFLSDMGSIGDILLTVTATLCINYAIFGNFEPALHSHNFPRKAAKADATRSAQAGTCLGCLPRESEKFHGELKAHLAAGVRRRQRTLTPLPVSFR